jgi:hypothetical protein
MGDPDFCEKKCPIYTRAREGKLDVSWRAIPCFFQAVGRHEKAHRREKPTVGSA